MNFKDILRMKMAEQNLVSPSGNPVFTPSEGGWDDVFVLRPDVSIHRTFRSSTYKSLPKTPRPQRETRPEKQEYSIDIANLSAVEHSAFSQLCRLAGRAAPDRGPLTLRELHRLYRCLVRMYHPDINPNPEANEHFLTVTECFSLVQTALTERKAA